MPVLHLLRLELDNAREAPADSLFGFLKTRIPSGDDFEGLLP